MWLKLLAEIVAKCIQMYPDVFYQFNSPADRGDVAVADRGARRDEDVRVRPRPAHAERRVRERVEEVRGVRPGPEEAYVGLRERPDPVRKRPDLRFSLNLPAYFCLQKMSIWVY